MQRDYQADMELAQRSAGSIEHGLDGRRHDLAALTEAARALDADARDVVGFTILAGSELKQPSSHSAVFVLEHAGGGESRLFLKKITAAALAHKAWNDKRRSLLYLRNEVRIYRDFPELPARGVRYPRVARVEDGLGALEGEQLGRAAGDEPDLTACGACIWMQPIGDGFEQNSPLPPAKTLLVLKAAARLHAAAWEDAAVLSRAAATLQSVGGSFALAIRNPKEIDAIPGNWASFVAAFGSTAPQGFFDPLATLGERMQKAAPWIAARLAPAPTDACACLVHGDLKAMNTFLPVDADDGALLIDFASTGVGFAMADVAMHLTHALVPADLEAAEDSLLDAYLAALGKPYDAATARRHYELGVLDYGRFVLGRFWGGASPESFAKKKDMKNVALVHRDVASALNFVRRLDAFLAKYEPEIR